MESSTWSASPTPLSRAIFLSMKVYAREAAYAVFRVLIAPARVAAFTSLRIFASSTLAFIISCGLPALS
eukprot:1338166-Amphidinium_carterae.1